MTLSPLGTSVRQRNNMPSQRISRRQEDLRSCLYNPSAQHPPYSLHFTSSEPSQESSTAMSSWPQSLCLHHSRCPNVLSSDNPPTSTPCSPGSLLSPNTITWFIALHRSSYILLRETCVHVVHCCVPGLRPERDNAQAINTGSSEEHPQGAAVFSLTVPSELCSRGCSLGTYSLSGRPTQNKTLW